MSYSLTFLLLLGLPTQATNQTPANPATSHAPRIQELPAQKSNQPTTDLAALIAPFVADDVIAVANVDLQKADVAEVAKWFAGPLASDHEFMQAVSSANTAIGSLKDAGAREFFVMLDAGIFRKVQFFVITLNPGSDPKPLMELVKGMAPQYGNEPAVVELMENRVVCGPAHAINAGRKSRKETRTDLATAVSVSQNSPFAIQIIPSQIQRKALEEMITNLPGELGGGPITDITRNMAWGTLFVKPGTATGMKMVLQGRGVGTAGPLVKLARHAKVFAAERMKQNALTSPLAEFVGKLNPESDGDQMVIEISPGLMGELFIPTVQAVREIDRRSRCVNNLKQIGLAMFNYHDAKKMFPRQTSLDKSGKPLLSWRVQILPYLDQQALYDQFHLDEPWDSPHNKALIAKMPAVFICPGSKHAVAEGKTCYLVPHGERTILSGANGGKLKDIFDGTSRTMMAADMGDNAAVTWTKPEDWHIGDKIEFKPLLGHHPGGTNILFVDGAVHFINDKIKPTTLKALITRDGGEVISPDVFSSSTPVFVK